MITTVAFQGYKKRSMHDAFFYLRQASNIDVRIKGYLAINP